MGWPLNRKWIGTIDNPIAWNIRSHAELSHNLHSYEDVSSSFFKRSESRYASDLYPQLSWMDGLYHVLLTFYHVFRHLWSNLRWSSETLSRSSSSSSPARPASSARATKIGVQVRWDHMDHVLCRLHKHLWTPLNTLKHVRHCVMYHWYWDDIGYRSLDSSFEEKSMSQRSETWLT